MILFDAILAQNQCNEEESPGDIGGPHPANDPRGAVKSCINDFLRSRPLEKTQVETCLLFFLSHIDELYDWAENTNGLSPPAPLRDPRGTVDMLDPRIPFFDYNLSRQSYLIEEIREVLHEHSSDFLESGASIEMGSTNHSSLLLPALVSLLLRILYVENNGIVDSRAWLAQQRIPGSNKTLGALQAEFMESLGRVLLANLDFIINTFLFTKRGDARSVFYSNVSHLLDVVEAPDDVKVSYLLQHHNTLDSCNRDFTLLREKLTGLKEALTPRTTMWDGRLSLWNSGEIPTQGITFTPGNSKHPNNLSLNLGFNDPLTRLLDTWFSTPAAQDQFYDVKTASATPETQEFQLKTLFRKAD